MERELPKNLSRKPAPLLYPEEKKPAVKGMRSMVTWIKRRIGCRLRSQVCPAEAVEVTGKEEEAEITYHVDRCIFCGECIDVCPTKAIEGTGKYELAFTDYEDMILHFKRSRENSAPKRKSL